MHARPPAAAAVALILAGLLVGCSSGDDTDVASLGDGPEQTDDGGSGDEDVAADFVDCLVDGGVTASLTEEGGLQLGDPDSADATSSISMDENGITEMKVDGVDIAPQFNACQEQFPDYEPFQMAGDLSEEEIAAMDAAAREWAECAREAGFTSVPDPEEGGIQLPGDLTLETATAVGAACPMDDFGSFAFGISAEDGEPPNTDVLDALIGAGGTGGTEE